MLPTEEKFHGLTIDHFIDPDKLAADVKLNETDLNDAFLTQAGLAAYYGVLAARAAGQLIAIKVVRDTKEAEVASEIRARAADKGAKVTEASIREELDQDPRVIAVNKAYALATQIDGETKAAVDAIRQRRDMLIQLGASSREEAKGAVRLNVSTDTVSDRAAELKSRLAKKK